MSSFTSSQLVCRPTCNSIDAYELPNNKILNLEAAHGNEDQQSPFIYAARKEVDDRLNRMETAIQNISDQARRDLAELMPSSFHQATIYFCLVSENASWSKKVLYKLGSVLLIFMQCVVSAAIGIGTVYTSCFDEEKCAGGLWCNMETNKCESCFDQHEWSFSCNSSSKPQIPWATATTWTDETVATMCESCMNDAGEYTSYEYTIKQNARAMNYLDWLTLTLASLVLALSIFNEVRDCMLCDYTIATVKKKKDIPWGWRFGMFLIYYLRIYAFLPSVLFSSLALVMIFGGSSVDICLNSVAVLFLVEVDNLAFAYGIDEESRLEVELRGRVSSTLQEQRLIDVKRWMFIIGVPLSVLGAMAILEQGSSDAVTAFCTILPFLLSEFTGMVFVAPEKRKFHAACLGFLYGLGGLLFFLIFQALTTSTLVI